MKKYLLIISVLVFSVLTINLQIVNAASTSTNSYGINNQVNVGTSSGTVSTTSTAGCQTGYLFSPTTGQACEASVFPPGCTSNSGYSFFTGQSCNKPTSLTITTTSIDNGYVGTNYSSYIYGSGGTGSYKWTISAGSLPPGLSLSQAQIVCIKAPCYNTSSAMISGMPMKAGEYKFTIKLTDGNRKSVTKLFYLGVKKANPSSISVLSPNGGETWQKGTAQTIKWGDNSPVPSCTYYPCETPVKSYSIVLQPYNLTRCTSVSCSSISPYVIAKTTSGTSYNWKVGNTYNSDSSDIIPDGSYTIQVCDFNSPQMCDSSDSYFKITSGIATNTPPKITGTDSSTKLKPGEEGNFFWSATDANNDNLTWSVNWGDGVRSVPSRVCSVNPLSSTIYNESWNYRALHAWKSAGKYTITAYVSDCKGGSDSYSFDIVVESVISIPTISSGTISGAQSFYFTQRLQRGSEGNEVMELQKYLNRIGYNVGIPDGKFGLITQAAVVQFQIANNLANDGVVGEEVRVLLNK